MSLFFDQVYCDLASGGWTLISRFSNADSKNWMLRSAQWWYDKSGCTGNCISPSANTDMVNQGFYQIKGNEFKITRSDDTSHEALLSTTSNCLSGRSFRSKITSYGNFRYDDSESLTVSSQETSNLIRPGFYLRCNNFKFNS